MTRVSTRSKTREFLITLPPECLRVIILELIYLSMPQSVHELLSFETQTTIHTHTDPWPNTEILGLRLVSRFFATLVTPLLFETLVFNSPRSTKKFLDVVDPTWIETQGGLKGERKSLGDLTLPRPIFGIGPMVRKLVIWWKGKELDYCKSPEFQILARLLRLCSQVSDIVIGGLVVWRCDEDDRKIITSALLEMESPPKRARIETTALVGLGWSWYTTNPFLKAPEYWGSRLEELVISAERGGGDDASVEWKNFSKLRKVHLSRQAYPSYQRGIEILENMGHQKMEKIVMTPMEWATWEQAPDGNMKIQFVQFDANVSRIDLEKVSGSQSG